MNNQDKSDTASRPGEKSKATLQREGFNSVADTLFKVEDEKEAEKTVDAQNAALTESNGEDGDDKWLAQRSRSRKKHDKEFFELLLLILAIEDDNARIGAIIRFHEEQMEILLKHIREAGEFLEKLRLQEMALQEILEKFRETGRFDVDHHGALKNEKAEAAVRAYESKTGNHIDRTDPASYPLVVEALENIRSEEAEIEDGIRLDQEDYERHKAAREEALEIKAELQSGDPTIRQQGLERMKTLGQKEQTEITANAVSDVSDGWSGEAMESAGLIQNDLEQDEFSFKFPPLLDDFNQSSIGSAQEQIRELASEPVTQKLKGPSISPR